MYFTNNNILLFIYFYRKGSPYKYGHVVSNGSFSKVLFPSLRLGWLECSHWIASQLEDRFFRYCFENAN